MEKFHEKPPIEEGEITETQRKIETESEQIRQLLENEQQSNPEYRECLEKLRQEFERRVAKVKPFVQNLSKVMGEFDWFIVPPVMTRTDYGYLADIDLVIVHDSDVQIPDDDTYNDDVFIIPAFITKEKITRLGSKYPEVAEWYKKKLYEEKPEGKPENQPIDVLSLEEKIRYSIAPEKREQLRNFRLILANYFMEKVKKRIEVVSWDVSGSTVADIDRFSVCSDLDLEILIDPKTTEQEKEIYFYLHHYLQYKFAEDYGTKICFTETTLDLVKKMAKRDPKVKSFFEKQFRIEL